VFTNYRLRMVFASHLEKKIMLYLYWIANNETGMKQVKSASIDKNECLLPLFAPWRYRLSQLMRPTIR
jgi:hypothetical protein